MIRLSFVLSAAVGAASIQSSAYAATALFDFENLATSNSGALTSLTLADNGLIVEITRPGSTFDIRDYPLQNLPIEAGDAGLSPFSDETNDAPFVLDFSQPVNSVGVWAGDYGADTPDIVELRTYSESAGSGVELGSSTVSIPTLDPALPTPNYDYLYVEPPASGEINSATLVGGTPNFPHSVYYDLLSVEFDPVLPVPAPLELVSASTYAGKEIKLLGDVESSGANAFDPSKPTIVVTHGWQPDDEYTGDYEDVAFSKALHDAIDDKYGDNVNIVVPVWENAHVGLFSGDELPPLLETIGGVMAVDIKELFMNAGAAPNDMGPIHFIGHSYGSRLSVEMADFLSNSGFEIDHVTVLDAPTDTYYTDTLTGSRIELPGALSEVDFLSATLNDRISYIENYYGVNRLEINSAFASDEQLLFGLAESAWGSDILGYELNGGYPIATSHAGVWEEYVKTIFADVDERLIKFDAFDYSAALQDLGGDWDNRPTSPKPTIVEVSQVLAAEVAYGKSAQYAVTENGFGTADIRTASDGYLVLKTTVPEGFSAFEFVLEFVEKGDGDWFEVLFDGETLLQSLGLTAANGGQSFALDMTRFAGKTGFLSLILASDGPVPASVKLSDMRYTTYTESVSPVPLPAGAYLLVSGIGLLAMGRMKNSTASSRRVARPQGSRVSSIERF